MIKEWDINDKLFTRDGRYIGDAIVISKMNTFDNRVLYTIKTNYGNVRIATQEELENAFHTELLFDISHLPEHKHAVTGV
jgi:hypothetical protein